MSYKQLNVSERLTFTSEALAIVQTDPTLNAALADIGYHAEAVAQGLSLEQTARDLRVDQNAEYVSQLEASRQVTNLEKALRSLIASDRTMVRNALRPIAGRYNELRLSRGVSQKRSELLQQARNMYLEIQGHEDVLTALTPLGFTPEVIASRLAFIAAFAGAMEQHQLQIAQAQVATRVRREAMDALDTWMLDFLSAARHVFRKDKEQLKKIGIPIRRPARISADPEDGAASDTAPGPDVT